MKNNPILILLGIVFFACASIADDDLPTKVTVTSVDLDFAKQKKELSSILWDSFVGRPEQKDFSEITTRDWRGNYAKFSDQLVAKAKAQGLDAEALKRCLASILPKEDNKKSPALLPVGAYLARNGDAEVWVVVCQWEYDDPSSKLMMSHIRVWALDAKTLKEIAFVSCR